MNQYNRIEKANRYESNTFFASGSLESLGSYLFDADWNAVNFVISGGVRPEDRIAPLYVLLAAYAGPVIVLHDQDRAMEAVVQAVVSERNAQYPACSARFLNQYDRGFEPFLGMNKTQVSNAIRRIAQSSGLTPEANLEEVVSAHIDILEQINFPVSPSPVSLSGFQYLCGFKNMDEFYHNVLALPCGKEKAKQIWAALDTDPETGRKQFALFRTVIEKLAYEASRNCWNDAKFYVDGDMIKRRSYEDDVNCARVLAEGGFLTLAIDSQNAEIFLEYLVEELKMSSSFPALFLVDGVNLSKEFLNCLRLMGSHFCFGFLGNNVLGEMITYADEQEKRISLGLVEKVKRFIILKHNTSEAAEAFSRVAGNYDEWRFSMSDGFQRGIFQLWADGYQRANAYNQENTYRVKPEDITSLGPGQAIVFDTFSNQILRFN